MSLRTLLALTLLLCSGLVRADALHDILQKLAEKPLVRADFVQDKSLPALKKPLHSQGWLVFSQAEGVLLHINQPVNADLVITADTLVQKTARTQTRLRLEQSPYGAIASIFSQLMQGNAEQLSAHFTVLGCEYKNGNWQLQLQPRDKKLQKLFSRISLSGDDYLRDLRISESNNGETHMQLRNHRTLPPQLDENEKSLFALAH